MGAEDACLQDGSPGPAFCCLAKWNELHPFCSSCRRCILNAPALFCPHSHVLQLKRPRATAASCQPHGYVHVCVCVCAWVAVGVRLPLCVCALYSFSSALAHFRSADTETDTMAGSEFWCISGEAAPRLMVERAREEFMFNLRKIMIIFYFMVERTTTSSYFFSSFPMHPGHIFRMHK